MEKILYSMTTFERDMASLAQMIQKRGEIYSGIYGVPRGGVPVAVGLSVLLGIPLVDLGAVNTNTLVVDDVVDSGRTRLRFRDCDFASLHIKQTCPVSLFPNFYVSQQNGWIEYPWEANEATGEDVVTRMIELIGDDPGREGLLETPSRVMRAWQEMYGGYCLDPEAVFKNFDGDGIGGLVYLKDIEFYSTCEHHMLPFYGTAMIAYIPNGKIIGVSKLARLLDIFARRLQVQERITEQVTSAIMDHLSPVGAACLIEAKHLCIACRGVKKQHSVMGYSSMKGVFLENSARGVAARSELISLWGR